MVGAFLLLLLAIAAEVAATASLGRTEGFRNLPWTAVVLCGYAASAWLLALVVRTMSVSVAYALWAGIGTAAIVAVGAFFLGEHWDLLKLTAVALIILGVVMLNLHQPH